MCSLRGGRHQRHLCGATLVSPRLALTAAYCVAPPMGAPDPVLWCGLHSLYSQQPGTYDVLGTVETIV
jgi:V8-like Glu-specific endopeptidase